MNNSLLVFLLLFFLSCNQSNSNGGENPVEQNGEFSLPEGEDPLASEAWHLKNTGQSAFSSGHGVPGEDLRVSAVHKLGITGKGVRIAVSDSGVEVDHPDLSGNQLKGEHRNYYGAPATWHDANPTPMSGDAHGTAVTGLSAAIGWNGIGSRGVAPGAKFAGFYFIGRLGDNTSYEARILDQISGDFDVFNYSYGYAGCSFFTSSSSIVAAYKNGVTKGRGGLGSIYVKAAGNEFEGTNFDCSDHDPSTYWGNTNTGEDQNHPYLIMVGAVNASGKISSYSSPGSGLWVSSAGGEFGDKAPAMVTTDLKSCEYGFSGFNAWSSLFNAGEHELNKFCNYTNAMNGTSSAAPTLAGVVALVLESNPDLTWRDVKHILLKTAEPINYSNKALSHPGGKNLTGHVYDYQYVQNAAGYNFSNTFGFGRVNAQAAVEMARNYNFPLGQYRETITNGNFDYKSGNIFLNIPDGSAAGVSHSQSVTRNLSIESVQIKVTIDHPFIGNIGVELTSPSGTTSKVLLINSNIKDRGLYDYTLLTNAFYGEKSQGSWKIKVIDAARGSTGVFESWELKINGAE